MALPLRFAIVAREFFSMEEVKGLEVLLRRGELPSPGKVLLRGLSSIDIPLKNVSFLLHCLENIQKLFFTINSILGEL